MAGVQLVHWKESEVAERLERIESAGFEAFHYDLTGGGFKEIKRFKPDLIVIDLSRLPSHGLAVGIALRQSASTRQIPLVFVDGLPEKVARVKHALPDAIYTTWPKIRSAFERATTQQNRRPHVPKSDSGPYSSTPLAKKLGIKPGSIVQLIGAPDGFETLVAPLPEGAVIRRSSRGQRDMIILFVSSLGQLDKWLAAMALEKTPANGLWIAWPKRLSQVKTDVSQTDVRRRLLAAGLVDYKICAIDETWSGMKFTVKKPARSSK